MDPTLTVHGVDGLKGHDLGFGGISLLQHLSQIGHIVVAENKFRSTAVSDSHDHRGVVARVRVDLTT